MKILYTLLFVVSFNIMCAQIDPSFGTNGHFTFGTLDKDDYPSFIKPTLDNAFIVGDYEMHTTPAKGVLYKVKSNGTIDSTFANGLFEYNFLPGHIGGFYDAIQLQDSSYLVFGNYGLVGVSTINLVIKLDKNGVLDNTYNVDGKITHNLSPLIGAARAAMVDTDGSILLAGAYTTGFALDELYVCRFDSNGFIDNSFATNGLLKLNVFDSSACFPVKIFRPDNLHYLIPLRIYNNGNRTLFLRLHNNGTIDSSFGMNGLVTLPWVNKTNLLGAKIHNNNCFLYGGYNDPATQTSKSYISKTDFNGQVDFSFGTGGIDTSVVDTLYDYGISGLEIDVYGNFLISGTVFQDTAAFYLIKKTPSLQLDNTFGVNGLYITKTDSTQNDFGNLSCLLQDGSWIVGGHYHTLDLNPTFSYDINMTFCKVKFNFPSTTEEYVSKEEVILYPNPCYDKTYVQLPKNLLTPTSLEISSLLGQRIQQTWYNKNKHEPIIIHTADLDQGLYLLNIQYNNGTILSKMFQKQ